jgi:hypothetical protein
MGAAFVFPDLVSASADCGFKFRFHLQVHWGISSKDVPPLTGFCALHNNIAMHKTHGL